MPREAVDGYTYDVLRRSNMRVLDTNDKVRRASLLSLLACQHACAFLSPLACFALPSPFSSDALSRGSALVLMRLTIIMYLPFPVYAMDGILSYFIPFYSRWMKTRSQHPWTKTKILKKFGSPRCSKTS